MTILCHFFVEKSNQKLWLEELDPARSSPALNSSQPNKEFLFNASRLQIRVITKFKGAEGLTKEFRFDGVLSE